MNYPVARILCVTALFVLSACSTTTTTEGAEPVDFDGLGGGTDTIGAPTDDTASGDTTTDTASTDGAGAVYKTLTLSFDGADGPQWKHLLASAVDGRRVSGDLATFRSEALARRPLLLFPPLRRPLLVVLDHRKRRYFPQRIRDLNHFPNFRIVRTLANGAYGVDIDDYASAWS